MEVSEGIQCIVDVFEEVMQRQSMNTLIWSGKRKGHKHMTLLCIACWVCTVHNIVRQSTSGGWHHPDML